MNDILDLVVEIMKCMLKSECNEAYNDFID